ncbi:cytochrome c oxidase subunit II [Sphingomonas jatrophae]|uniref:Cytochrome c oxidase subunit 2 n=1 Tax=Sphingomonas jatrophae TaxID=1166337 RepID=A0A1I6LF21_9SPHN|nr:cytochrome c oxidase subunit II [Sphingomonas jatrophae]SFS01890.1 cytochrome c oxidase subunit 2 [Sphingomonas jatrophae]
MTTLKTFLAALALTTLSATAAPLAAQTAAPPSPVANPGAVQTAPQGAAVGPAVAAPAAAGGLPVTSAPAPAAGPTAGTNAGDTNAVVTDAEAAASAAKPKAPPLVAPTPGIGMPDGRMGLQDQFTEVGEDARTFHNAILMPIITAISLLVLALLLWVIARYRRSANPIPSRTSHNTTIEVIWTLAPVLLLVVIAVPSIRLLAKQYAPPKADLTVKVIGNQWYWTYQYPDNGDFEVVSNMLKEKNEVQPGTRARTDLDGPRLLAVDERMVVPAGAVVKLIVTSNDVIHSFAVPAFWNKMDAVPGRLNETWFKVDRPGVYFGQCSELCGARHAFMPIAVEVVPPAQYAAWVASKGGTMPGAAGAANPDATTPASPATAAPAAAGAPMAVGAAGAPSDPADNATAAPAPTTQGATANEGSQTK